jgi:drug/metabolite transporter (DMT)-like permease
VTPERMAELVARWVRFYTRNLPPPIAQRRADEIDADLHDHIAHERAHGTTDRRIALSVAARMLRGLAADVSWRGQKLKMSKTASRPVLRVALATAFILLLPLVAMQITDEVDWGLADFAFAGVLLGGTGLLLHELAARKAGSIAYAAVATAIGVAAIVLGEADDAPGLVLFGGLLIVGTVALAVRTAQRSE